MKNALTCTVVFCSALFLANGAQAAITVNFNGDTSYKTASSYQENNFKIYDNSGNSDGLLFWGNGSNVSFNANPGGNTLTTNYFWSTMTLTNANNGVFALYSMDVGNAINGSTAGIWDPSYFAGNVVFEFTHVGGAVDQQTVTVGSGAGLNTIVFNETKLTQVTWTPTTANSVQVDNIVTPVPAAVWLFGSALAGLLGFKRKRA